MGLGLQGHSKAYASHTRERIREKDKFYYRSSPAPTSVGGIFQDPPVGARNYGWSTVLYIYYVFLYIHTCDKV